MNVLFVSNDPTIFDASSPTYTRMKTYADAFGELHIVSRGQGQPSNDGPLHLHPVQGSKVAALFALPKIVRTLIVDHGIEVVSAQDPFEHGFAALQAVRGTKAKLHVQVHTDFLSPWFARGPFVNGIRLMVAGMVLANADGIRVVSERIKRSIVSRYGARVKEPAVIPLTVDPTVPNPVPLPPHQFSFALLTAARLEPEKRIEDILQALTEVDASVGLIVVGEGSERTALERLAKSLNLSEHVIFTGWRTDQRALIGSTDAYIQASAFEGYSRTLIEAALAKRPIITTDVGIVGDVLRDGSEALVASPKDPQKLAEHIKTLQTDPAFGVRLGMAAEVRAREHLASLGTLADAVKSDLARLV